MINQEETMSSLFKSVKCLECGEKLETTLFPGKCPACGSAWLDAGYAMEELPSDWTSLVTQRPTNLWRYQELLPFPNEMKQISMGEGWTPLTRAEGLEQDLGLDEIWVKDERQQPTGSFKDRQASCTVSALKSRGIKEMVLASTGNAAAAYAAYCARAGIKLWVFLTSSVPAEKMRELGLYGAEVIKIAGTYDQAKKVAGDFAARRGIHYDTGAKAIPDKESMKTLAFEIAEQLGWHAPDWYIQAVSGGLGPLGVLKGFQELHQAGLIDKVPKIGVVQVDGCAPMVRSWEKGLDKAEPVTPDTLITVLSTGSPGLAYNILNEAIAEHGGAMVSVSDGEAFRAMRRIARTEGFSVEPATSVAFAGLEKLIAEGHVASNESLVINCSGHTFSAEKHALEDQYVVDLQVEIRDDVPNFSEGLGAALEQLDEQVTTIMIIDDNPHDSRLIRKLLKRHKSYRIFEAQSGPEGVDLARQRKPDLILLDLTLPEIDGFSILDELKQDERTSQIPVIIVSGKDLTSEQQAFLDSKAESIMQKGRFSGKDLVNQVLDMLGDEAVNSETVIQPFSGLDSDDLRLSFGIDGRPSILIVDDNVWDARLLRKLFETRKRFEVFEAHSASQALEVVNHGSPDLILLDLIMPKTSGLELLEMLRANDSTRDIPIIIVSGKELQIEERSKLALEVDSVWTKGMLDRNSFLTHVETLLTE
jgi:threonine synthase